MKEVSKCEEQTMIAVWKCKEPPDLQKVLSKVNTLFDHQWKPQTVSTFLSRLKNKGYLTTKKEGRYCYYYPTITLEQYRKEKMKGLMQVFYNGETVLAMEDLKHMGGNLNSG